MTRDILQILGHENTIPARPPHLKGPVVKQNCEGRVEESKMSQVSLEEQVPCLKSSGSVIDWIYLFLSCLKMATGDRYVGLPRSHG